MILRLLLLEVIALVVVLIVWFLGPLVHLASVLWRIIIILFILLPPFILILWKYLKARKASDSLEAAIKEQAAFQRDSVRPDRRDEINKLGDIFQQAISALKRSKLGKGPGTALYALPWYMIIGPPAVGKSTALLNSGLKFPFSTGSRKAIKGLGGTRNCDWWFSDQAILLDTAGRYTSEDEDLDEWISFLRMLKKYRRRCPINGLIVCVNIAELMTSEPGQIEELAAKLRARVDQVIEELDLALPVYLLFTKCDLLSGFIQFFSDLTKSARSQIFGFTVPPTNIETDVEELFNEEFNLLVEQLRQRTISRLASAKSNLRGDIFGFPLQFNAAREPLSHFISHLLVKNPYVEMPRLRGVYFCSGTQEGRPVDKVMGMMSKALGVRELVGEMIDENATKKSYFLRDVFTRVIFPDQNLAGSSASGKSRRKKLEMAMLGASVLFSASILGTTCITYTSNKRLIGSVKESVQQSRLTNPDDPGRMLESLKALDGLGKELDKLHHHKEKGPPFSMGMGFYQGNYLLEPVESIYLMRMRQMFVMPVGSELEATLGDIANSNDPGSASGASTDFDALKTYIMVTEPQYLDIPFASSVLVSQWQKRMHPDVAKQTDLLSSNARRYLELIKAGQAHWLDRDNDLVNKARHALRARDTEYRHLVDNLDGPLRPFTIRDALRGRVQTVIISKYEVPGVYTRIGWTQKMQVRLTRQTVSGNKIEPWVLGEEENKDTTDRLKERYFEQYIIAWQRFIKELSLQPSTSSEDALRILEKLTEQPALYAEILGAIAYNTELPLFDAKLVNMGGDKKIPGASSLKKQAMTSVEKAFLPLKEMVFASNSSDGRPLIPGIQQYQTQLEALREALGKDVKGGTPADGENLEKVIDEANRVTKGILATLPGDLRRIVSPLFFAPIENASNNAKLSQANRTSSSFNDSVCGVYKEKLAGRYPFESSSQDALLQDVVEYFSSKGAVWTYYNDNFKNSLPRKGDTFKPAPGKNLPAGIPEFFDEAWAISRALFSTGSDTIKSRFQVRPHPAILESGGNVLVSEIALEVEGKKLLYRNGPAEQWTLEWTGQEKKARLLVKGSNGYREELTGQGEWALRRLIDQGKIQKRGAWYSVEWPLKGGKINIPMDFSPDRSYNPLFTPMRLTCH